MTRLSFNFKQEEEKEEQPTLHLEPIGDNGYYKYKRKFLTLEYGLALSPFLKSGVVWFYIFFSLYTIFLFFSFLNNYTKGIIKEIPLFLQNNLLHSNTLSMISETIMVIFFLFSLFLAFLLYSNHRRLARFIIIINMTSTIIFFIGIFKLLFIFK